MRLLEPIPDDKVTVELKMDYDDMYGLSGFSKLHKNGYIGTYWIETPDAFNSDQEFAYVRYYIHANYYLIGFSIVKVTVFPEH